MATLRELEDVLQERAGASSPHLKQKKSHKEALRTCLNIINPFPFIFDDSF